MAHKTTTNRERMQDALFNTGKYSWDSLNEMTDGELTVHFVQDSGIESQLRILRTFCQRGQLSWSFYHTVEHSDLGTVLDAVNMVRTKDHLAHKIEPHVSKTYMQLMHYELSDLQDLHNQLFGSDAE